VNNYGTAGNPDGLALGDFNGDHKLDIASSASGRSSRYRDHLINTARHLRTITHTYELETLRTPWRLMISTRTADSISPWQMI